MRNLITRLFHFSSRTLLPKRPINRRTLTARMTSSTPYPKDDPSNISTNPSSETTNDSSNQSTSTPLALPSTSSASNPTTIDMSSGNTTVQLDHLGPMVVNTDGTMSRISNWDKMAEIEKKATLRIIGKRNQARLEALRREAGEGNGKGE